MASNRYTLFLATGLLLSLPSAAAPVSIAAVVGDEVISSQDVEDRRELVMATAGIPNTVENQQKITPRIVQSLVDETLELQEAKRLSIEVTSEEIAKAMNDMGGRGDTNRSVRELIKSRGLSEASLERQLKAQLAWAKVVQRKLRKNVSISQDEIARAKAAEAANPGLMELKLAAFELNAKDEGADALAKELHDKLAAGTDSATLAVQYVKEAHFNPPQWVGESRLPAPLQQQLGKLKPGEVSEPLRGASTIHVIQVLDGRTVQKSSGATEYAIKQWAVTLPKDRTKAGLTKLRAVASAIRANPGACDSSVAPKAALPVEVNQVRMKLAAMSPQQRSIISQLEVGQVSEPLIAPDKLRLVMLCEKIEPPQNAVDGDAVRQQLYAEKLELAAQKHLRNLRRDTFVDIKGE